MPGSPPKTDEKKIPEPSLAEAALSLFQNHPDGILVLDQDLKVLYFNQAAVKLTNLPADSLKGEKITHLFPLLAENALAHLLPKAGTGQNLTLTEVNTSKTETDPPRLATFTFAPFKNAEGKKQGALCTIHRLIAGTEASCQVCTQSQFQPAAALLLRTSADSKIKSVSPAFAETTGYLISDLLNLSVFDFLHPEDKEQVKEKFHQLVLTGKPQQIFFRIRCKSGAYRWFRGQSLRQVDAAAGLALTIETMVQDITHQKQTEEQLQSKSKLLNGLLSNLPVMVKRIAPDGSPVFMQGKALRKLTSDYAAKHPSSALTGGSPEVKAMIRRAMTGESVSVIEKLEVNGKPVIFRSYFFPDLENPGGAIGFSIDITEQKLAEEKLVRNQEFIKKITDSTPFIISIFDFNRLEFVYTNRQVPEMLGYTLEEVTAMGPALFMKLIHPSDLVKLSAYIEEVARAQDGDIISIEIRVKDKNGVWRWYSSRSSVFRRDSTGKAERALSVTQDIDDTKKNKDLLSGVLDSSPNGILALQAIRDANDKLIDFEWVLVNATTESIIGINVAEILDKRYLVTLEGRPGVELFDNFASVVETGTPFVSEYSYQENNKTRWLLINSVKMGDGCVITLQDITAAKESQEKILKNETLLVEAQKIAHLGIYEVDITTNALTWSDELYRIYELEPSAQKISLDDFYDWLHPDDVQRVKDHLTVCLENCEPIDIQYRILTATKAQKVIAAKGEVLCNTAGTISKMIGTVLDITELVTVKEELENIKQLRMIGEAIPQMVWTSTPEGKNDYMNRRWYEYTGLSELQDRNWDWERVIHPDDLDKTLQKWADSLETGKQLIAEFRIKNARGQYRWHLARMVPMRADDGTIIKWFGTATDIQHQKQIQNELEEAKIILSEYNQRLNAQNRQLQKTNSDLDTFIYTASHDLKAPIHNIEGLVGVLESELDTQNTVVDEVLSKINLSINRFKTTVLDLTEISKVERAMQEEATVVKMPEIMAETESDIAPLIAQNKATLITEFKESSVVFSKKNMRSVLYNLVSNAIKYRSPDRLPVVEITTKRDREGNFILTVSDNGLGLEEKNLAKVFEMFRRIYTHVEGTGVGLYIVKRLIENAGGTIHVESTYGEGTTFIIKLPQPKMIEY